MERAARRLMTRMATAAVIRENLAKAQEYQYKQGKSGAGGTGQA